MLLDLLVPPYHPAMKYPIEKNYFVICHTSLLPDEVFESPTNRQVVAAWLARAGDLTQGASRATRVARRRLGAISRMTRLLAGSRGLLLLYMSSCGNWGRRTEGKRAQGGLYMCSA